MKTRPATKTTRASTATTPRAAQGVEVSLCVMLRGLTPCADPRRASAVRCGFVAPETAADFVALATHAIDVGGEGEVGYAMRNAPMWTREAERLGAAPADVALLRSVFSTLCSRNGVVAA